MVNLSHRGWIRIHRKIQDHWLWEDKPFSRGQAWVDILLLANHEDKKIFMDGELIEVCRGEHITSEPKLASRWGWSRTKVRNFLEILEQEGMLKNIKEGKKRTRLKVLNYNTYQDMANNRKTTDEQPKDNRKTTEEQPKDINNNDNNDNNDNNEKNDKEKYNISLSQQSSDDDHSSKHEFKFGEDSIEIHLARFMIQEMLRVKPDSKVPKDDVKSLQVWAQHIDYMIRLDKRTPRQIAELFRWAQQDDFWCANIRSPQKLRKQWDTLELRRKKDKKPNARKQNTNLSKLEEMYQQALEEEGGI